VYQVRTWVEVMGLWEEDEFKATIESKDYRIASTYTYCQAATVSVSRRIIALSLSSHMLARSGNKREAMG
jgi:hypothetical protein